MKIDYIDINLIKPYKSNPRINMNAIEKVAESIKEFGFKVPIVLNNKNIIINGHTRYEASKLIGLKVVPVIYANDLNEEQQRLFRIVDNKSQDLAEWDYLKLDEEIDKISLDMDKFGFEESVMSFIEETLNSGIAGIEREKELYGITITFENKYEDLVKKAVNKYGKEAIINEVLKDMEE